MPKSGDSQQDRQFFFPHEVKQNFDTGIFGSFAAMES